MPSVRPPAHAFARRKPAHRIIIAHGEAVRSYTVRPWAVAAAAAVAVVFGVLYLGATGYLVFRDDLLAASIARQTRMQHAYEDRIAALRADIDRLTSRQLLNQRAVEVEVERLLGRQAALDARQDVIAGLSQAIRRAGIGAEESLLEAVEGAASPKPAIGGPSASLAPETSPLSAIADVTSAPVIEMHAIESSLDELARQQVAFVDAVAAAVNGHTGRIESALKALGHRPPPRAVPGDAGLGGPFVPIAEDADPETFRESVELVTTEIDRLDAVRRYANQLPLARPIQSDITSRYGRRIDPFLGKPAMHTGIDFRAPLGSAVHATADGTVVSAEANGGYGNMVEIDHGNGLTTRFGHLSRIDVIAGEIVGKGAVVGRSGSTGRSTGPHLHYEIRIDGAAIDPLRYIKAGNELAPLL